MNLCSFTHPDELTRYGLRRLSVFHAAAVDVATAARFVRSRDFA